MQALLCDICENRIQGIAHELHHLRGEAVNTEQGTPRIVQREGARMVYLCTPCGDWVQGAIDHLRESHVRAQSATRFWPLPGADQGRMR